MARSKALPKVFGFRRQQNGIPWASLVIVTALTLVFVNTSDLTMISSFASATFLLIFAAINLSAWRLRKIIGIRASAPMAGLMLSLVSWGCCWFICGSRSLLSSIRCWYLYSSGDSRDPLQPAALAVCRQGTIMKFNKSTDDYAQQIVVETLSQLQVDAESGLTEAEVMVCRAQYGYNEIEEREEPLWQRILRRFWGPIPWMIEEVDIFAEVVPEDKYRIVDTLQKGDHIVAMIGDGVNDAPALKKADCGFAVSNATDAARAAADIILTAPGLSVISSAVKVWTYRMLRREGIA